MAGLGEATPLPRVTLSSADAAARGIADGEAVLVQTLRGQVKLWARVTDDIVRGAVDANMGGGGPLGPQAWREANVNELTDLAQYDPNSGFPIYKALLCEVRRVEGPVAAKSGPEAEDGEPGRPAEPQANAPARRVYLDHNATTPLDEEVLEAMLPFLREHFGNPSSIHARGAETRAAVEAARRKVAQAIGCTARRLVFTGGGSEADNLAIQGVARERGPGAHLVTCAVEHPAVLATCRMLEREGWELTVLPVGGEGRVDPATPQQALRPNTALVSIMAANNEVGALQPILELARVAQAREVLFHTDAVQALGKIRSTSRRSASTCCRSPPTRSTDPRPLKRGRRAPARLLRASGKAQGLVQVGRWQVAAPPLVPATQR